MLQRPVRAIRSAMLSRQLSTRSAERSSASPVPWRKSAARAVTLSPGSRARSASAAASALGLPRSAGPYSAPRLRLDSSIVSGSQSSSLPTPAWASNRATSDPTAPTPTITTDAADSAGWLQSGMRACRAYLSSATSPHLLEAGRAADERAVGDPRVVAVVAPARVTVYAEPALGRIGAARAEGGHLVRPEGLAAERAVQPRPDRDQQRVAGQQPLGMHAGGWRVGVVERLVEQLGAAVVRRALPGLDVVRAGQRGTVVPDHQRRAVLDVDLV